VKKIALLLIAAAAFSSCSKKDDPTPTTPPTTTPPTTKPTPTPGFTIDGVHDVKLEESATSNVLALAITRINSNQAPVALSVSGLPTGVTAKFDQTNGTPSFNSMLTFSYDYTGTGGSYPVKVIGTSDSGKKEYNLNLTVPSTPSNGWIMGTSTVTTATFSRDSSFFMPRWSYFFTAENANDRIRFSIPYDAPLPGKDVTYKIRRNAYQPDEISIYASFDILSSGGGSAFNSVDGDTNTLTLTYKNGKYAMRVNTMLKNEKTGEMKRFVANLSE
jgi:hypothetical protein